MQKLSINLLELQLLKLMAIKWECWLNEKRSTTIILNGCQKEGCKWGVKRGKIKRKTT
jgi:hypothetical protein